MLIGETNSAAEPLHAANRPTPRATNRRKRLRVARRILGEGHNLTLKMRCNYAQALYRDPGATRDDLHESVTTLEEVERISRRVLGIAHPNAPKLEYHVRKARAALHAREAPGSA